MSGVAESTGRPTEAVVDAAGSSDPAVVVRGLYKRPFDLGVVALAVLLLLPLWIVLGVAIPLAIRLESSGPVLYRQARLGRRGQKFVILKYRTMVDGAAWRDARVTRVGRFLRRWHLDELPQVVNVMRGDMSLVGPRPERPELADRIGREVSGYGRRLAVRPGIAGLAQAYGPYQLHPWHKLRYDLRYIATMSPLLDFGLIVLCAIRVVCGRGEKLPQSSRAAPSAPPDLAEDRDRAP